MQTGICTLSGHNTKIYSQRQMLTSTAVSARFIQEQCMNCSQSKRQVVILDCCFGGAFAQGMSAKEAIRINDIDIAAELGGEGRAVLTSSTASQVSFEDQGGGVYTRYLVEGIEKGAADTDNDGVITVDELHDYAKRKVQSEKPAMKPEIYVAKEGYTIHLANAPVGDPKLEYRKEVERCVTNGDISELGRLILSLRQTELGLTSEKANEIEHEVLKPFREFQLFLQRYEQALTVALKKESVLSNGNRKLLKRLQQILKLRDEDVAPIHDRLIPQQPISTIDNIPQQATLTPVPRQTLRDEDDLSSEKGVDYSKLRDLLKAGKWKEADYETYLVIVQAVGRKEDDYLSSKELLDFPCTDLRTIDRLWVKYSNGRFGFSVQKQIYLSVGGKADGKYYREAWNKFGDRVGWKVDNNWIDYEEVTFSTSAPEGHLPCVGWVVEMGDWVRFALGADFRLSDGMSLLSHRDL
jgi:hypothetical protein